MPKDPQKELMPAEGALIRREEQPLVVVPSNPMELMTMAISKGADVGTIERLAALYEQFDKKRAKSEFDRAMADFQGRCPIIKKTKWGAKNAYKYATLDQIVEQVGALICECGFSYTITSEQSQGGIKAIISVKHQINPKPGEMLQAGHTETSEFFAPLDMKNPMQTDPQRMGGAMTYAKRYAFCNAFGILTADEDNDAGAHVKPKGPSTMAPTEASLKDLARELWNLLKAVRGPENNWNAANLWLVGQDITQDSENAPDFTAARFREVIAKAKAKLSN